MSNSGKELDDFWEEVDSGVHGPERIEQELERFPETQDRRDAEIGIELLAMLGQLDPDAEGLSDSTSTNKTDQTQPRPAELDPSKSILPKLGDLSNVVGVKIGRYELIEAVGRGGCGAVFRATDTMLRRTVALKLPAASMLVDQSSPQRFLTEARSAALLKHPNIVGIYEADIDHGVWYIASEYCSGPDLSQVIENPSLLTTARVERAGNDRPNGDTRSETIPPRLAARIVADLAKAVQHAHDSGVIHRDIKPANVMIENSPVESPEAAEGCVPKLTDFGLAKFILEQDASVTATGARVGTVAYMAPEQIDADAMRIGPATDIYGLGNLLYEMLTGQLPFGRSGDLATLNAIKRTLPPRPRSINPDVSSALEAITMQCLEKVPQDRFKSAGELSNALRLWLGDGSASNSQIKIPTTWPSRRRQRTRKSLLGIGALGGILAVAAGFTLLHKQADSAATAGSIAADVVNVDPLSNIRHKLVTYLPLRSDLNDASGNDIHARIGGGDPQITDAPKPAVELDGDGDYLTLDYPAELQFGDQTSFTIAGWFFLSGDQADRRATNPFASSVDVPVISSHRMIYRMPGPFAGPVVYEDSHDSGGWGLELVVGNYLRGIAANGKQYQASDIVKVFRNRWIFLCLFVDRDLAEMKFWIDDSKHEHFPLPSGSIDSHSDGFAINIGQDGTGKGRYSFKGRVRDLAIWRRVLADDEADALRNVGFDGTRELLSVTAGSSK